MFYERNLEVIDDEILSCSMMLIMNIGTMMFNEINHYLEKKPLTKVVFLVFLVISGVVEGNPRIGLFLNKCITLVLTLLEAQ